MTGEQNQETTAGANLASGTILDLSLLPESQRRQLLADYARGTLDIEKAAQQLNVDPAALKATLMALSNIAQDAAQSGNFQGGANMVFCRGCGKSIHESAPTCPHCGAVQGVVRPGGRRKDKVVAGVLALLLGGLGVHRFYLGQWWGIFYLMFCWTFIPSVVAFIEGIVFLVSSDQAWDAKYGGGAA